MPTINSRDEQMFPKLTPREIEIVSAVVAGYSNKEIADKLSQAGRITHILR